jgi:alpha-L-rhamnosidase
VLFRSVRTLAECPPEMGFSYPCNAGWRLWALARGGRADVIVKDLRERWAVMDSVKLNNTLQEDWKAAPDSGAQWSHCAVAPLYLAYTDLAGIRPLTPGFKRVEIRPQLADLEQLELTAHTVQGPLRFAARGKAGERELVLELPAGCTGELILRRDESVNLERATGATPAGHMRYRLPPGKVTLPHLKLT